MQKIALVAGAAGDLVHLVAYKPVDEANFRREGACVMQFVGLLANTDEFKLIQTDPNFANYQYAAEDIGYFQRTSRGASAPAGAGYFCPGLRTLSSFRCL